MVTEGLALTQVRGRGSVVFPHLSKRLEMIR